MGLFDFLGGAKKSASASHILVKDEAKCLKLKQDLSKSKDLATDFATAASQFSTCPSGKKGGSLGNFKQGQMVPAFDKVIRSTSFYHFNTASQSLTPNPEDNKPLAFTLLYRNSSL